jgi:adenylylsulfate kinase-like enzyme
MVIWITGISGSGKTTLAKQLVSRFKLSIAELVIVDGDEVRELFDAKLGYTAEDRFKQIQRIQRLTSMLDKQGLVVIVAALFAHPDLLAWNKENFSDYFEVYLRTTVEVAARRDPKGLYDKVAKGEMKNVVGIDVPWHEPLNADVVIEMDDTTHPTEAIEMIISNIPRFQIS